MLAIKTMNIKQLVDKLRKEADVQTSSYSVENAIEDINAEYLFRIEKATQIGSTVPISNAEATTETFIVVDGSNTFTRTIKDAPILRVDYMPTGGSYNERLEEDQSRRVNSFCLHGMRFFANEKQVFVEDGRAGTLTVTYTRGNITSFIAADYDEVTPPSPDWLPEVFHPLLWLTPALVQAGYYKPDRVPVLKLQFDRLDDLFFNHYGRKSAFNSRFETEENDDCFGRSNHR